MLSILVRGKPKSHEKFKIYNSLLEGLVYSMDKE